MSSARASLSPVLFADPVIRAIPVVEDGSPLVDLRRSPVRVVDAAPTLPLGDRRGRMPLGPVRQDVRSLPAPRHSVHTLVRATVAERLATADADLPRGVHLLVVEGLRPMSSQVAIYDAYRRLLSTQQPLLGPDEIDVLASRFVAPPSMAPHVSGAAVDLTLVGPEGPLDLGTPIDATPEESDGACFFDSPRVSASARRHRDLLAAVLGGVGLVNYPTEWWHWSFGDRYWAHVAGHPSAIHGPVDPPG